MFGDRLRYYRKKKKLSQRELGQIINKPQTTISEWERGKMVPDINEAARLATALEVKLSDLLEDQAC
nr:helix-turn-helix transcriptional regulator [Desulfofundulus thermobenzoicus]